MKKDGRMSFFYENLNVTVWFSTCALSPDRNKKQIDNDNSYTTRRCRDRTVFIRTGIKSIRTKPAYALQIHPHGCNPLRYTPENRKAVLLWQ
jgi:hypothetical protein